MNKISQLNEHGNIASSFDYFKNFNIPKNSRILDIGCNYGSLIYNLYQKGYRNIYGIDINKDSIEKGKKEYSKIKDKIQTYNGKKIPFKNETFDVVLMFDVIEHIPNVQDFLKNEVYRALKKDGTFIFQTPNKPMNILWVCIANKSIFNKKSWEDHCSLQTCWNLRKILKLSYFNNIKIEKYNILTEHNKQKVRKKVGFIGVMFLYIIATFPLFVYPNLWGSCKK